jgi:hypothetical protein
MVANSGQILHPSAPNHNHRVFLKVMTDAGNVGGNFKTGSQANPRHLTEGGVGLFRSGGIYASTNATTLRAALEGWRFGLFSEFLTLAADELLNGRHEQWLLRLEIGQTFHSLQLYRFFENPVNQLGENVGKWGMENGESGIGRLVRGAAFGG